MNCECKSSVITAQCKCEIGFTKTLFCLLLNKSIAILTILFFHIFIYIYISNIHDLNSHFATFSRHRFVAFLQFALISFTHFISMNSMQFCDS